MSYELALGAALAAVALTALSYAVPRLARARIPAALAACILVGMAIASR